MGDKYSVINAIFRFGPLKTHMHNYKQCLPKLNDIQGSFVTHFLTKLSLKANTIIIGPI